MCYECFGSYVWLMCLCFLYFGVGEFDMRRVAGEEGGKERVLPQG